MEIGTKFSFTEKPDFGSMNEELSGVTVGKVYEVSSICMFGGAIFLDDAGEENYAAGTDGMLKGFVKVEILPKEPDIHGYVIVHKITGERWGQCFSSKGGAKKSYNDRIRDNNRYKEVQDSLFDAQTEYAIKPLVILG